VSDTALLPMAPVVDVELKAESDDMVSAAEALMVIDQNGLTIASAMLQRLKVLRDRVEDHYRGVIHEADVHHKNLVALKRTWTDRLDAAAAALKPKMTAYVERVDAARLAAVRASELARKQVERVAEVATDKAHDLIEEGKSTARVLDKAAEKIEAIKETVPVIPDRPVAEGIQFRETWRFEIEHVELVPAQFKVVDETLIRKHITTFKHQATIPGVRIWMERTPVATTPRSGR
jgi:hypothetical protein